MKEVDANSDNDYTIRFNRERWLQHGMIVVEMLEKGNATVIGTIYREQRDGQTDYTCYTINGRPIFYPVKKLSEAREYFGVRYAKTVRKQHAELERIREQKKIIRRNISH